MTRPDTVPETLGLVVVDEPSAKQSDPTVLDLQLRTLTKQSTVKPVVSNVYTHLLASYSVYARNYVFRCIVLFLQAVHSIREPEKQPKVLDNWIESVR